MQTTTSQPRRTSPWFQIGWLGFIALVLVILVIQVDRHPRADANLEATTKLDLALQPLATAGGDQPVRVIVSAFSGRVEDAARAVAERSGTILDRFGSIGAVTTIVPADHLSALAADWRIRSLSSDGLVESAQHLAQNNGNGGGNGNGNGGGGGTTTTTTGGTTSITDGTTGTTGDTTSTTGTTGDTGGNWRIDGLEENHLLNTLGLEDEPWDSTGVNVAVIDSGVGAFHETPFYGQWDFIDGSNPSFNQWETASDPYGHGTHVVGLIANNGWQSGGLYRGVAPNINRLYSLRVLNDRGAGYTSDVIRALDWVLANQRRAEVDVINLSLGHPILESADSAPLVQAVEAAVRAGIVVVVSAGNYGYNRDTGEVGYAGIASPGNAPSAITAGAIDTFLTDTRRDDVVARYSSRGPTWYDGYAKPDVVAPGSSLTSTTSYTSAILQENPQLEVEKEEVRGVPHLKLSGTSMAAAVTTGVVAQMIHAQRKTFGRGTSLTPNAVKAMLQYAALDLSDYDVLTQGAGALNGDGAVALAASIDSTTAVGQWWLTEGVSETSTVSGDRYVWSQRLIWGNLDDGSAGTMGVR